MGWGQASEPANALLQGLYSDVVSLIAGELIRWQWWSAEILVICLLRGICATNVPSGNCRVHLEALEFQAFSNGRN